MKIGCIVLAGGKSTRMNHKVEKPFIPILGKPLVYYSLDILSSIVHVEMIICVAPKHHKSSLPKTVSWAEPGNRRQDSVANGFALLPKTLDFVLVHDGARPLIVKEDVERLIQEGKNFAGSALGGPVNNTLKRVDQDHQVLSTQDRSHLWEVYTPQMIQTNLLEEGLSLANKKSLTVTDDLSLLELLGKKAKLIPVSFPNLKVTYPQDLYFVEALLKKQYAI